MSALFPTKALTILQPWADLIVHGPKRVENRTWPPRGLWRGDLFAIHAGKRVDARERSCADEKASAAGLLGAPSGELPLGAIVGVARLAGVERVPPADDPWWCGPIGWRLSDVVAVEPIPCRGAQGLWRIPPAEAALLLTRWRAALEVTP